jgi:hypothetical protein
MENSPVPGDAHSGHLAETEQITFEVGQGDADACRNGARTEMDVKAERDVRRSQEPATLSQSASRQRDLVMLGVGLGAVVHLLRNPRFHAAVITGVIGLGALLRLSGEASARALERFLAWEEQPYRRSQRKARTAPRG